MTSVAVIAGVAAAALTPWWWLHPALAAIVCAKILWMGWAVVQGSVGGLLDEAADDATLARIRMLIARSASGALEAHDVRTRHAGRATFIDVHLVVPGEWTVAKAHRVCDRIEAALHEDVPDAVVTIHVEPEAKAKGPGVAVP